MLDLMYELPSRTNGLSRVVVTQEMIDGKGLPIFDFTKDGEVA